jgi:hypothetical protein
VVQVGGGEGGRGRDGCGGADDGVATTVAAGDAYEAAGTACCTLSPESSVGGERAAGGAGGAVAGTTACRDGAEGAARTGTTAERAARGGSPKATTSPVMSRQSPAVQR